jgi:hypothetical protein
MFPGSDRRFEGQGVGECNGEFGKVEVSTKIYLSRELSSLLY